VVSYLIEQNADMNAQNDDLDTPMHLALRANRHEIINLLLRQGANPRIRGFQNKDCIAVAQEMGLSDLVHTFESYYPNHGVDSGDVFIAHSTP
jgi:ankyrin repeat protein